MRKGKKKRKFNATEFLGFAAIAAGIYYLTKKPKQAGTATQTTKV